MNTLQEKEEMLSLLELIVEDLKIINQPVRLELLERIETLKTEIAALKK